MKSPLLDDTWQRRGISVLWDAESLYRFCHAAQAVSLRRFWQFHAAGWPEADMPLLNDKTLVVAGLDVAIDTLTPNEAEWWLEERLFPAILSFQNDFADGGSNVALIFWMAEPKRWVIRPDGTYHWHCGGEFKHAQLPLGRCLWNGVEAEVRQIEVQKSGQNLWAGLYSKSI